MGISGAISAIYKAIKGRYPKLTKKINYLRRKLISRLLTDDEKDHLIFAVDGDYESKTMVQVLEKWDRSYSFDTNWDRTYNSVKEILQ